MSLSKFLSKEQNIGEYLENNDKKIKFKEIKHSDLALSPFAQLKCHNCGMFRRNYHCLATPRWKRAIERIKEYDKFFLIYLKKNNDKNIKMLEDKKDKKFNRWMLEKYAVNINQVKIVSRLRRFLIEIRNTFPDRKLLLFGAGGGCRGCKVCGLIKPHKTGEPRTPCKKPRESFNAPESWGIDVYKTLENVNIEFDVIPTHNLIAVGMIFVKEVKKLRN